MTPASEFTVDWGNGNKFFCWLLNERYVADDSDEGSTLHPQGWKCSGKINGVDYNLFVENAAPTRVFQVLNTLYEAQA